jgi:hypothetical protein
MALPIIGSVVAEVFGKPLLGLLVSFSGGDIVDPVAIVVSIAGEPNRRSVEKIAKAGRP